MAKRTRAALKKRLAGLSPAQLMALMMLIVTMLGGPKALRKLSPQLRRSLAITETIAAKGHARSKRKGNLRGLLKAIEANPRMTAKAKAKAKAKIRARLGRE